MTDTHVVGVCGSLSDESTTRVALSTALGGATSAGAETTLVDLRSLELPVFDPDDDPPSAADRLTAVLAAADGIILATPTYHGSFSGSLKNALDHCGFDEFEHQTVGLVSVGGGRFPVPPLNHLREVCTAMNAWVLPSQVAVPRAGHVVADGRVTDDELVARLRTLGADMVRYAHVGVQPRPIQADENVGAE